MLLFYCLCEMLSSRGMIYTYYNFFFKTYHINRYPSAHSELV